jgi:hypothetical protein
VIADAQRGFPHLYTLYSPFTLYHINSIGSSAVYAIALPTFLSL